MNCISCWMSAKHFYAPNYASIFSKSGAEIGENGNFKALCFTSKCKKFKKLYKMGFNMSGNDHALKKNPQISLVIKIRLFFCSKHDS